MCTEEPGGIPNSAAGTAVVAKAIAWKSGFRARVSRIRGKKWLHVSADVKKRNYNG